MARYSDILRDQYLRPIEGAYVSVINQSGEAASIFDDGGLAMPNPFITNEFGDVIFNASDAVYRLQYRYGGRLIREDDAIVGEPPVFSGPPGPADNTYFSVATLKASAVSQGTANLRVDGLDGKFDWIAGDFTGKADDVNILASDNVPINEGAWVRQKATDLWASDGNTVQDNLDHGGRFTPAGTSAPVLTTASRLQQDIYLTDYASLAAGNDWTAAIAAAESDAFDLGVSLRIPAGSFGYSADQTFRCEIYGAGPQSTFLLKLAAATITFQKGVMADLTIGPASAVISGDTSDGLVLDGLDRKDIRNVWSIYHGGDGIVYKRGNLSRVVVHSRFNSGHGFYCSAETLTGDNKALEGWIEATGNGLSGFAIDDSGTTVQTASQFGCTIKAQSNGVLNTTDDNYDLILAGTGHTIANLYQESGAQAVWAKSTLKASRISFGQNSWVNFKNDSDDTNSINFYAAAGNVRLTTAEKLRKLFIGDFASLVGQLALYQTADRTFLLDAIGSGAAQTLTLGSTLSIAKGGATFARKAFSGGTLSFGTVTANGGSKELSLTVTGLSEAVATNAVVPFAAPQPAVAVPAGVSWCCYLTGGTDPSTDPPVIHIRVVNSTAADVTIPSGGWIGGFML